MRHSDPRHIAEINHMIVDLGLVDYQKAYEVQKEYVRLRKLDGIDDILMLCEHNAIFTIGRTGRIENLLADETALKERGIKVLRVDRGGDITFHGPGQLVIYPITDLRARGGDLHRYLRYLEAIIIDVLNDYSVYGERVSGHTGVWVGGRKIASIGIAASNWITFHGVSLNVNVDLKFFSMIRPCGLMGVEMTSLSQVLGRYIDMAEIKDRAIDAFDAVLA